MRCAAALLLALAVPAAAYDVEVLQDNGPPENRIDLVILGDGYRDVDQAKLTSDARAVVDGLFGISPYQGYRGLFNVRLVHVVSHDEGADNGSYGAVRDTALGTYFNCNDVDRLLCADNQTVVATALRDAPNYDLLIVVVNDPKYGGSGGDLTVLSTHSSAVDLLRHELSHSIGGLADEYESAYSADACNPTADCPEPNATVRNTREGAKWAAWIDPATPVPTPEGQGRQELGLYEGCRYVAKGVYRPQDEGCLMRSFSAGATFCAVCTEGLVRSFWRRSSPFDSLAPPEGTAVSACQDNAFSFTHPPAAEARWFHLWTLDGRPLAGDVTSLTVPSDPTLAFGHHKLEALAQDRTALVRNDPDGLLAQRATWIIDGCGAGPCVESAGCQGATCVATPRPAGLACGGRSCVDGFEYSASTCDGSGLCVPRNGSSCGRYRCDAAGLGCLTSCTGDGDCAKGSYCAAGACRDPLPAPSPGCQGCSAGAGGLGAALALVAAALGRLKPRAHPRRGRSTTTQSSLSVETVDGSPKR